MEMRANMMPPTEYGPEPLDTSADDSVVGGIKKRRPGDGSDEDPEPFEPYVDRTIREFVEDINSDAHIQCILDVPGSLVRDDGITKYLSDGHLETSTASYAGANLDYEFRPADIARTANWCLLHQAGFLTHGHMDTCAARLLELDSSVYWGGLSELASYSIAPVLSPSQSPRS
ncbi:hypothetical protein BD626DRAFT_572387 [Schizophyllum amplum]|uniref:Uncharacterized protein n=1 Tax=Schizophyllum amplum TaxID=97359 RepID=A0A550C4H7_9AGAR|nr:hypothetical protein BD626DRAFT_572387 [Auriculariopsis ampla]